MMNEQPKRIEIPLPNGDKIVAEANPDPSYPEIYVYIENEDGVIVQDLCIAGAQYDRDDSLVRDMFRVLVYSNENSEGYTNEILVRRSMDDVYEKLEDLVRTPNGFDDVFEVDHENDNQDGIIAYEV